MALADMQGFDVTEGGAAAASPDALFQLGLQYSLGRGVRTCPVTAHKWFNIAALRGNQDAKLYRSELAAEMSKTEIAEAQRQAREWLRGN